jgi:SAM-dependent methyltransferase
MISNNLPQTLREDLTLAEAQREVFRLKVGAHDTLGWSPRIRQRFGYFTPDEWYEAILLRLINNDTDWLDVGCGHALFPSNNALADILAARCRLLVGIDPDENIYRNPVLHERERCLIDEYETEKRFDIISLRMVAEHIADPPKTIAALKQLTRDGGRVIIYTVSKWAPASLAAAATPMAIHDMIKRVLWGTSPEDTFPTLYRMNTRKDLRRLFESAGFAEESFLYLNDCRSFGRWRLALTAELSAERLLRTLGLRYPEMCLLGIYRKQSH